MAASIAYNELSRSALLEAGNIGVGNAMTALSELVRARVDISVPTADIVPIGKISSIAGDTDAVVVAVYLRVTGDAPGHVALLWPEGSALLLADRLLERPSGETEVLGELECSALVEVGNILASAYLTALGNMTGLRLLSSPPGMAVDTSAAILCALGAEISGDTDEPMIVVTQVRETHSNVEGCFLFVPDSGGLPAMLRALEVEW